MPELTPLSMPCKVKLHSTEASSSGRCESAAVLKVLTVWLKGGPTHLWAFLSCSNPESEQQPVKETITHTHTLEATEFLWAPCAPLTLIFNGMVMMEYSWPPGLHTDTHRPPPSHTHTHLKSPQLFPSTHSSCLLTSQRSYRLVTSPVQLLDNRQVLPGAGESWPAIVPAESPVIHCPWVKELTPV